MAVKTQCANGDVTKPLTESKRAKGNNLLSLGSFFSPEHDVAGLLLKPVTVHKEGKV